MRVCVCVQGWRAGLQTSSAGSSSTAVSAGVRVCVCVCSGVACWTSNEFSGLIVDSGESGREGGVREGREGVRGRLWRVCRQESEGLGWSTPPCPLTLTRHSLSHGARSHTLSHPPGTLAAGKKVILVSGKWNSHCDMVPCDDSGAPLAGKQPTRMWTCTEKPKGDYYSFSYFTHKISSAENIREPLPSDSRWGSRAWERAVEGV